MKTLLLALATLTISTHAALPGYYRFPAIHGDTVVFTAEGDLWRTGTNGGTAQRLTTHPGAETQAAFSPDGKWLAFSAQYEGPTEVYVMPADGGLPKRLTWDGEGNLVNGWTPQGRVIFSTKAHSTLPNDQLATVDPETGATTLLPLAQASEGGFDESGKTLYFSRLPHQGSSTKRYKGGWIQSLWKYEEAAAEAVPLTQDFPGTSKTPMWWAGRIYFLSDRDGVMNLWSIKPDGSDAQKLTAHTSFDAKSARLDGGRIIYQHGADLRLYDIAKKTDVIVPIVLASDFDQTRERWVKKPFDYLTSAHLSPDGDRVALTARGQVFVAPVEPGRLAEAPRKEGVRYRSTRFLRDGKSLLTLSDESGELEFWKLPANGVGKPEQLTADGGVFRFPPVLSPDGKWIAWQDKDQKLWVRQLEEKKTTLVGQSLHDDYEGIVWSPDSQWLAYVEAAANTMMQIHIFRPSDNARAVLTSDRVSSYSPAWSADGNWIYFLSDRSLRSLVESPWGARQPDPYFTEVTKLYALALKKNLRLPFTAPDELHPAEEKKPADKPNPDAKKTEAVVSPDLDGIATRLHELPVPAGNYHGLSATERHLFFTARSTGFDAKSRLMRMDISAKDAKPKLLVDDVGSWELSANGKRLLVRQGDSLFVVPSDGEAPAKLDKAVPLDNWTFSLTPREEWRQIYAESWRMMRDYFYDPKMHGVDWPAIRAKYEPLLARIADRAELSDILSEMAGEISALHIFVRYGDSREGTDAIKPAFLGASLVPDAAGWRVQHVYRADPDYPATRGPLDRPDSEVREGEVIVSINGTPTLSVPHPAALLRGQAGKQVLLEVRAADGATRQVLVRPQGAEQTQNLRYDEWELSRRNEVERLGGGKIGYVHLRAMGGGDIATWARDYFPVFNREGLIIDVRHNRGGSIDSWILGKLLRKAWFYWSRRVGEPYWNMQYAFRGHVVVICNERTASDGEAFSEGFRRLGLGKVIGTRTWGGEIWLSAQRWLVDNGMCTAAESGVYGPEGSWLIEGHGVEPDIVVDNPPRARFDGKDAQLEAAIRHLQDLIAKDPRPVPATPAKPDKAKK
jgi:tricorn protease